jgi:protein-tyrosine-phosphatase
VSRDDVRRADLVLAMGLEQLREVVALEPGAWPRAHTVRGFLGRSAGHPARAAGLRGALETWHAGRRAADLVLAGSAEDVPDPVGGPREGYAAMGRTFDELAPAVAAVVLDAVHAPAVEG